MNSITNYERGGNGGMKYGNIEFDSGKDLGADAMLRLDFNLDHLLILKIPPYGRQACSDFAEF